MASSTLVPRDILGGLFEDFEQDFRHLLGAGNGHGRNAMWSPPLDVSETTDSVLVRMDVPGMDAEDISIELRDDMLTISGERTHESERNREGAYRRERYYGRFARTVRIPPATVSSDQIVARLDRGVLELTIPKTEAAQPRRIEIVTGEKPHELAATGSKEGGREGQ